MTSAQRAIADTSIFIGLEAARIDGSRLQNYEWAVSVVTLGELRLGVLNAQSAEARARRLSTFEVASRFEPLEIDEKVAESWALIVAQLRASGRKIPINDAWIAATAIRHQVPVVTQDRDYDGLSGVEVIQLSD